MTLPTIVPTKYTGTSADFRLCKAQREGQETMEYVLVNVPTGTVVGTNIGLVPFRAGARFNYNSVVRNSALGGTTTATLGYIYDDNINNTNAPTAFIATPVAVSTAGANIGGANVDAGMGWKATGDGWIVVTTAGTTTGTTGTISGQITITYDQ